MISAVADQQALARQRAIGERMARVRLLHLPKVDQEDVGAALDVSRGIVANWEIGRTAQPEKALSYYAANFGVSREWLLTGDGQGPRERDYNLPGLNPPGSNPPAPLFVRAAQPGVGRRAFPLVGNAGASSFPVFDGNPEDFEEFSDDLHKAGRDQFCVTIRGDSCEPGIRDLDIVLFDVEKNFRLQGVYVVVAHQGEGAVVKILRKAKPGGVYEWELVPENPEYPIMPIYDDGYRMIGPVIGLKRRRGRDAYMELGDRTGLRPDSTEWKTR